MSRAILWFRNDQRLADHAALTAALARHTEVLPVLVIDPRQHGPSPFGFERLGPFRAHFLREGQRDLDAHLRKKGSALLVCHGDPATVLRELTEQWNAHAVYAQRLYAWEEQEQERQVSDVVDLHLHDTNTLLHSDDLPFAIAHLPQVFTAFRTEVEKRFTIRDVVAEPAHIPTPPARIALADAQPANVQVAPSRDTRSVLSFSGGRTAALARLQHYLWDTRALSVYKETRNGLVGADYSSKFSPWLATGAISAREVYHAVKHYEKEHGANESTYWLVFELLWRDFFQFIAAKHGADLFMRSGIAHKAHRGNRDAQRFAAWGEGRTGQPFIDANMRELAATGWMSNRGRQNVASYLVNDLALDWRMGASWFESLLIDYDACSNWGNWQYLAGVGNDPREGRRFDPVRQARLYDPEGAFVRLWAADQ
ncbi:MAG: DASH family cryptochrome [Flavobacteriales bacterium]|nr:DASH family cryptochrome [Flavobacteriales bacterium]